jgi:hypothetical protein
MEFMLQRITKWCVLCAPTRDLPMLFIHKVRCQQVGYKRLAPILSMHKTEAEKQQRTEKKKSFLMKIK